MDTVVVLESGRLVDYGSYEDVQPQMAGVLKQKGTVIECDGLTGWTEQC